MLQELNVIVVGCGTMGSSHARAYASMEGCSITALVDTDPQKRGKLAQELNVPAQFDTLGQALAAAPADIAVICTYPDSHGALARQCLSAGLHVFVEKPLATSVEEARNSVDAARESGKKLVVGYILRQHPAWMRFIEIARTLGKPLVMRMNLNQQSVGASWDVHKNLMKTMSPIVDCGVHYVDVMCQMTRAKPTRVQAIGARLSGEIAPSMYNYGQLQVQFDDGSAGWYEAAWGPMVSEEAFFIKDVIGPKGCVSIVKSRSGDEAGSSADIDSHTKTNCLRVHYADLDSNHQFAKEDQWIDTRDEPNHQELCIREQAFLVKAIREDLDLTEHWDDAINSLRVVLAADESVHTGRPVEV